MNGVELIAAERLRQVEEEDWDVYHDAKHTNGVLAVAAACLAVDGTDWWVTDTIANDTDHTDIWGLVAKHGCNNAHHDDVRSLVIAGALIVAEIDRVTAKDTS